MKTSSKSSVAQNFVKCSRLQETITKAFMNDGQITSYNQKSTVVHLCGKNFVFY